MKWIKCSERMPDKPNIYFLKCNGGKLSGSFVPPSTLYFKLDGRDEFLTRIEQFENIEWLDEEEAHDADEVETFAEYVQELIYEYVQHLHKNPIKKSNLPINDEIDHISEWWESKRSQLQNK